MNADFAYKLRQLFLPAAAASIFLLIGYSALNWLLLSRAEFLDQDAVDYWIPLVLAILLELGLVMPRLPQLSLGNGRARPYYNMIAIALIAGPALLGQTWIRASTGKITHVTDSAMIAKAAHTRYYAADSICLDRVGAGGKGIATPSGHNNEYLDFTIYIVIPVCTPVASGYVAPPLQVLTPAPPSSQGPAHERPSVWVAVQFHKTIDNNLSQADKEKAYSAFAEQTTSAVNALDTSKYRYLERAGNNSDRRYYDQALQRANASLDEPHTYLIPHTEPFDQRQGDWLTISLLALVMSQAVWLVMIAIPPLDDDRVEAAKQGTAKKDTLAGFLIPNARNYGLTVLLYVNVLVFLAMVMSGLGIIAFDPQDLIAWGGNYDTLQNGQVYRLFSSQFVHGGIMHLVNNMYGLCIAGIVLSSALPNWRLILCYLVTGLGGCIAAALIHPDTVSVGASGAILGLWGVMVAMVVLGDTRLVEQKKFILTNGAIFVGLTVAMGSFTPGIDNAAHIGGFVSGLVLGGSIALFNRFKSERKQAA